MTRNSMTPKIVGLFLAVSLIVSAVPTRPSFQEPSCTSFDLQDFINKTLAKAATACSTSEGTHPRVSVEDDIEAPKLEAEQCPICLETLEDGQKCVSAFECSHVMHESCTVKYIKSQRKRIALVSCPLCRSDPKDKRFNEQIRKDIRALEERLVDNYWIEDYLTNNNNSPLAVIGLRRLMRDLSAESIATLALSCLSIAVFTFVSGLVMFIIHDSHTHL